MKFTRTEPDENFDEIRLVSENNVWEMGVHRLITGWRIVAGLVGSGCYEITYPTGADQGLTWTVLFTVYRILSELPEDISLVEIRKMMPTCEVKPINLDPCWGKLLRLADKLEETNTCSDDVNKVFADNGE